VLESVSHENIVHVHCAVWQSTSVQLVMPVLPVDLSDVVDACEALLHESVIKTLMRMLLSGLAYLHSNGIAHRVRGTSAGVRQLSHR